MPLDLQALHKAQDGPRIEPRDIFATLTARPWPRLRVEQDQVLKAWYARRSERDLVIRQNTGGGKTVVGLLVAQSSLNEGVGPAAYLVPDTYLVKQVMDEADQLGLAVTDNPRNHQFRAGNAILVCTFEKVVNGRTVFGLAGAAEPVRVGTVIVDDAHAALAAARKQFTVDVPSSHPAYARALALFGEELRRQSPRHGAALLAGDRCAPLRIPFWSWAAKSAQLARMIEATAEDDTVPRVFFPWPLLADHAHLATATITDRELQLRTPCPPIDRIPAFHLAKRRIYLTATLADDGVLVTELGADASSVRRPITPERASDLGARLILAPAALNPEVIDDSIRSMVHGFSQGTSPTGAKPVNVVVLVPSDPAAQAWEPYADHVLHVDDMKPVIDKLVDGKHQGLVVLVNKYDGVDLPGKACRLLVLDGIPTPLDPGERREAGALAGSHSMRVRKIQRIEQGLGRGIRDAEDFCAVLLMGNQLALSLVDPEDLRLFSPATRAQIEFSQRVASQIAGDGLAAVEEAVDQFLRPRSELQGLSRNATAGVAYDTGGHVSAVAEARRNAWNQAAAGDHARAATILRDALDGLDDVEKGWWLEEVAAYQHELEPTAAQDTLRAAKKINSNVLLPIQALPARPVRGNQRQAHAAIEFLKSTYPNPTALQLGINQILDDLSYRPGPENTEAAEAAMKALGLHLGLEASRPEKEESRGPDCCWGLGPTSNAVIELKTGTDRPDTAITKSEIDQLAGSVNWNTQAGGPTNCLPVLIARDATLKRDASAPPRTRIITPDTLDTLKTDVQAFTATIATHTGWPSPTTVARALQNNHLTADNILERHSITPTKKP